MIVPKNLSTKYKPILRTLNRVDLFYYLLPCICFILIIDIILLFTNTSNILVLVVLTIILFGLSLIGLIKLANARLYMYCFWLLQWIFQHKRKDSVYLKQLLNIKRENIINNTIENKTSKIYKEIYELSADSINFLFESKQARIINNFTNFFHLINNETVTFISIPIIKDYQSQIDYMVDSFKDSYSSKISNVVKFAKLNEINSFRDIFINTDMVNSKIFLVFHNKSEDNRKLLNALVNTDVYVNKVTDKTVIEILNNLFLFNDFNNENDFDYKNISIKFQINNFITSKRENGKVIRNYGKFFAINNLPNEVDYTWLADLFDKNNVSFALKVKPVSNTDARKQLNIGLINAKVDYEASKNEFDKKRNQLEYELINEQLNALVADNDKMFKISIIGQIKANTQKDLNDLSKTIFGQIKIKNYEIDALIGQQEKAYASFVLKKYDYISNSNNIFIGTKALGYSYPFSNDNIQDSTGYYLGSNLNGEPMVIDFSKYDDYKEDRNRISSNGIVIGKTGSGKSFFTKKMIKNKLLANNWEINIIDPDGEYKRFASNVNGQYYDMSEYAINPFDIWVSIEEDDNQHQKDIKATHINKLDGFFSNLFPHFSFTQTNILNDAIKDLYKKFKINLQDLNSFNLEKIQKQNMPLLEDLYDFLVNLNKKQHKIEIQEIIENLKPFVADGMYAHLWNRKTNLRINDNDNNSKINVFDVKAILNSENKNILPTQFFLIIKFLQFRIFNNRKKQETRISQGLKPNLYVSVIADEFHKLRNSKLLKYLVELYKTIRKYFGDVWTISQDLSDWKENNAKEIIDQSIFKFIFKLDQNAIDDINQLISASGGLNKAEELQIINAQQGEALVIYEERRIILSVIASEFESILLKKEGNILNPKDFEIKFNDL